MNQHGLDYVMSNVGTQGPALFVLLVAAVLSFVYFGRATIASVLTLIAVAVMVASKIGVAMMAADLVASKDAGDLAVEELTRQMANLTFLGAVGQAVGLALLVAAIFVRRQKVRLAVS